MLSVTQNYFIKILKSYFIDELLVQDASADISEVVDYAKKHEIATLVYSVAKNNNIELLVQKLKKYHVMSICYSVNNEIEYNGIFQALLAAKIDFVPIKGIVLQKYYKHSTDRSMGDVDLLINMEDSNKICTVFEKAGFKQLKDSEEEIEFVKQDKLYELHSQLVHSIYTEDDELQSAFFNDFWKYTKEDNNEVVLDWNFHLLFLFNHLAKHLRIEGAGFRQFIDIAVLIHFHNDMFDWKWIVNKSKEIHLYNFIVSVLAFCKRWFGINVPIDVTDIDDDFYEYATEKIFENGVFGYDSDENVLAGIEKHSNKHSLLLSRLIILKYLIFPSYNNLIQSSKYDYLKGKPWLLPIAWMKRGFTALKYNNKGVKDIKQILGADNSSVMQRKKYLNKWGL